MASNNREREERIRTVVAAMLAEEAALDRAAGRETIDDIENEMVRIGDLVAREVGLQKLARHTDPGCQEANCPKCGHAGEHLGEQTRELHTRRGKVPLTESKYRCPKCRQHFFPSERGFGS